MLSVPLLFHTLAHTHTHPYLWSLYSCTLGADLTLAIHESQRQRGREGQLMIHFMLFLQGPRHTWTVTRSTQRDTGRQSGRRNTRAWQIELAAVGLRRTEEMGAGLLTQEWQRVTGHVKFMASPGLHGCSSPKGHRQAPHCETVVALLIFWPLNEWKIKQDPRIIWEGWRKSSPLSRWRISVCRPSWRSFPPSLGPRTQMLVDPEKETRTQSGQTVQVNSVPL